MLAITSSSGILHDFEIYVGIGTVSKSNLGISGNGVLRLAQVMRINENYKLDFDNWF